MNVTFEGSEELLALQKRFEVWASLYPRVMRRVLKKGLNALAAGVRRNLRRNLHKRTGKLAKSITSKVVMDGRTVDGEVYPRDSLSRMIAAVQEQGVTRHIPGGQPYMVVTGGRRSRLEKGRGGQVQFVSRHSPAADWLPKTKPSVSVLPARPSFQPALATERPKILRSMRDELMKQYSKRRKGIVEGVL